MLVRAAAERLRTRRGERAVSVLANASVEHTAIGRIVVPPSVPAHFRLFYTTIDFDGRIDDRIRRFVAPATVYSCQQVHGGSVCRTESGGKPPHSKEPECDALWSEEPHRALVIKVADCLPV